jgi:hypothetical protein
MPVDRGWDVTVVGHLHDDLGALPDAEGGTRNRSVVREPPDRHVADTLGHRRDPQVEPVAIGQPDGLGRPGVG